MIEVGLYCGWDESFDSLIERMSWATPTMNWRNYKDIHFVPPDQFHSHALVFNATGFVWAEPENTYVILFEPPEILGEDNPWLKADGHPQAGAHIYSFCSGTEHPQAMGLHLPQATIAEDYWKPSKKPLLCSMICSTKSDMPYHRKRLQVMDCLMEKEVGIAFYGRGLPYDPVHCLFGELPHQCKDKGLRAFTFAIDFENNGHYAVTDKFIDPLLNATVPITNSPAAQKMFGVDKSYEYVSPNLAPAKIASTIVDIIYGEEDLTVYDRPVLEARRAFTSGQYNICEWLYRKLVV